MLQRTQTPETKRPARLSRPQRRATAWRVLASSATGTSHLSAGRGCDDRHGYRQLADGTLLLAVADGAGSAPRSAEGAACAVRASLDALETALHGRRIARAAAWQRVLQGALSHARAALEGLAGGDLRAFATTLLVAAVRGDWLAVAQVGDGAVVVRHAAGAAEALTWPDHGEYANETLFLTSSGYAARAQRIVARRNGVDGIALFSDGLERLALDMRAKTAFGPFFEDIFAFASGPESSDADLTALLESDAICDRTDDDKTLVIGVRR